MLKLIYSKILTFPVIPLEHFIIGLFCRCNKVPISCKNNFSLNFMLNTVSEISVDEASYLYR